MANTILIVEDDKEINSLLCKALENYGYNAKSAFTGIQGLDMLKNEPFDMLLLDIMLPYKVAINCYKNCAHFPTFQSL